MSRFALNCVLLCGSVWVLFGPGTASAQDEIYLEPPPFKSEDQEKFKEDLAMDPPATEAQLQQASVAAKYLVYRLTKKGKTLRDRDKPGAMNNLVRDNDRWIQQVFSQKDVKNTPLQQAFRANMLEALDKVMAPRDQRPIVRVNAARILARLAAVSGHEETADLLVKVIEDPGENDGTRYWALRGLRDLLARAAQNPPVVVKNAQRRMKIAETLVQFVERKPPLEKNAPLEELDGQRVLRREGIRALAQLREPFQVGSSKANAAIALLRILRKDKDLTLEPRLDEQTEAAIGLCLMNPDARGEYQPGYAAYHIAQFLATDFTRGFLEFRRTHAAHLPWKVEAARLADALKTMLAASPNDATVKEVAVRGGDVLREVEQGVEPKEQPVKRLAEWLEKAPAPTSVYKNDLKAVVNPRASGEK